MKFARHFEVKYFPLGHIIFKQGNYSCITTPKKHTQHTEIHPHEHARTHILYTSCVYIGDMGSEFYVIGTGVVDIQIDIAGSFYDIMCFGSNVLHRPI